MNIDWADERAIGLRCSFYDDFSRPSVGTLKQYSSSSSHPFKDNHHVQWPNCKILQGEKTEYVSTGQPVPDGVLVSLWTDDTTLNLGSRVAEDWAWDDYDITHFRVEETEILKQQVSGVNKDGSVGLSDTEMSEAISAWDTQKDGNHYKTMLIQPMEYSMANKLDALQHTAIKYISRFRDKNGIADLEKAKHCIDMLIEWENKND